MKMASLKPWPSDFKTSIHEGLVVSDLELFQDQDFMMLLMETYLETDPEESR